MKSAHTVRPGRAALKCELASEALRAFGALHLTATGWSMLPSVRPGDTLMVEPAGLKEVRLGDIVVIRQDGNLVSHRVISVLDNAGERRIITQGDTSPVTDVPVCESELLGGVSCVVRKGKSIALPRHRSLMNRLTARMVSRSLPAARALVALRDCWRRNWQTPQESVLSCQS